MKASLDMRSVDESLHGIFFPAKNTAIANINGCYFNSMVCMSCVFDVKDEEEYLKNFCELNLKYYTDFENWDIRGIKSRIEIIYFVKADSIFSKLNEPLLFKTDSLGKINRYLIVDFGRSDLIREFFQNTDSCGF